MAIANDKIAARDYLGVKMAKRGNFPVSIPDVIVLFELGQLTAHSEYASAKGGNTAAAIRLAQDMITDDIANCVSNIFENEDGFLLPVLAQEAQGKNKIPLAIAKVLQVKTGIEVSMDTYQVIKVGRTQLDGLERIFAMPEFDGGEMAGKSFLMIDDTLTQGGTFAALASHIQQNGGKVIGGLALTGKQYSAKLTVDSEAIDRIKNKYGDLENDFVQATGYGFDALTSSEARYLASYKPSKNIRARILEERDAIVS